MRLIVRVLLTAAVLFCGLSGLCMKVSAEGSGAWGASLPEYAVVTTVNVVKDGGADKKGNSDCYSAFQECLDLAKDLEGSDECIEITIPKGTYLLARGLKIYSNTRIICANGAKIVRCYNGGAILSTAPTSSGGYSGAHDILIQGGTWDGNAGDYGDVSTFSNLRIGHAKNIVLRGMTITNNKNGHHIEVGGTYGLTIENCKFSGYYGTLMKEAIQLDVMNKEELFAGYSPFDDTACENVVIRGCTFSDIPRAIGSHSAVAGVYYSNITITDNKFTNVSNYVLYLYNYKHCTIKNNTFEACGAGILFNYMSDENFRHYFPAVGGVNSTIGQIDGNADTVIENNTIDTNITGLQGQPFALKLYGLSVSATSNYPAANYYISNVYIRNNTIDTAYCGIIMNNVYNAEVSGNSIYGKPESTAGYLISANYLFNSSLTGNTVSGGTKSGFCAMNSSGLTAENNSIDNCADVAVLMSAVSDSSVNKNSLRNNTLGGIKLDDGCSKFTCSHNVISDTGYAIKVDSSGSGKDIKLKNNDISSAETGITCVKNGMAYMVGNSFEAVNTKLFAESDGLVTLSKPRSFDAEEITSDRIKLTWKAVGEAAGINVYRKRAGSGDFQLIATGDSGSIFEDEMLEQGTNYVYKAVPFIIVGNSFIENTPSDEIGARTKISVDRIQIECVSEAGFTARPVAPAFHVTYGGRELRPDVDYTYSYDSNVYAGTAGLTVTGRGNYIGSQTVNYQISVGAPRIAQAAEKVSGAAGAVKKVRCEVKVERLPEESLAVGSKTVNPIQRAIDSVTVGSHIKITTYEKIWTGSGFTSGTLGI